MLKPSMKELLSKVGNRYLLVNLAAQRARDIAQEAEEKNEQLPDKAVKLALDEIAAGTIVYCPGPKVEPEHRITGDLIPGMLDLDDHDEHDEHEDADAQAQTDDGAEDDSANDSDEDA